METFKQKRETCYDLSAFLHYLLRPGGKLDEELATYVSYMTLNTAVWSCVEMYWTR